MPRPTRRTLLAAAPAIAAGGAAAQPAAASEVAAAYAAYLPVARSTYPRDSHFATEEDCMQAREQWWPQYEAAVERLVEAPARSLADLEMKLQVAWEDFEAGDGDAAEDFVSTCLRDIRAMQGRSAA